MFLTHHNLQGSQTDKKVLFVDIEFLTHHNLQGSQTVKAIDPQEVLFLTHHNLQGSQTINNPRYSFFGFLPIIIYKVLKPDSKELFVFACFLPIIIYKVLKQIIRNVACLIVSYPS